MPAHILVIEDNPSSLELMSYLLTCSGFSVSCVNNGVAGVAAARSELPDLILCDIEMPRMDGYEVASALKADTELASIPLIAVTAAAMAGDRDSVLASGFDGYMPKPIDPETFVAEIGVYLPLSVCPERRDARH